MRYGLVFCFLVSILFASCKKDMLHWQKQVQLDGHTTHRLNKILFVNDSVGFIVGGERFNYADILTTRDGGNTWSYLDYPEAGKALFGITKAPGGRIYAIGFDGKLIVSADTGKTWQFKQLSYQATKAIAFSDDEHGVIVGGVSFDAGCMVHIDKDGNYKAYDSILYEMNDIKMASPSTGYIAGFGVMLKTSDSGKTWQYMNGITADNFTSIDCHGPDLAWTCGSEGSIYKMTDGKTWNRLRNGNELGLRKYHLKSIIFVDDTNGYAVGEKGAVIHSDDGGEHWMELDNFTDADLWSIAQAPNGDLIVCGQNGTIFRLLKR